jgi:hypothetical protein
MRVPISQDCVPETKGNQPIVKPINTDLARWSNYLALELDLYWLIGSGDLQIESLIKSAQLIRQHPDVQGYAAPNVDSPLRWIKLERMSNRSLAWHHLKGNWDGSTILKHHLVSMQCVNVRIANIKGVV